jgi:Tfp pilus assembly protein PilF
MAIPARKANAIGGYYEYDIGIELTGGAMAQKAAILGMCLAASLACVNYAAAQDYEVILKGTVTMEDGTPPPFQVGVETFCSDVQGSAPGPITNKKGEYIWRMKIDPFRPRACVLRATHAGYTSTSVDVSGVNTTSHDTTATLPPVILTATAPDAYRIEANESNMPGKAKGPFHAAMKALDNNNEAEAAKQLQAAVDAAPKFAAGWHALGILDEKRLFRYDDAKAAYQHAIEADPKLLSAYVTLAHVCVKTKDWQKASETSDALIKADTKRAYPEIYLHRAVALYGLKDFAGAQSSIEQAIKLDPMHKRPRAEYVLGRILEAKGDTKGATEHIANYLGMDPGTPDSSVIKSHLENIGKPDAPEPELEL